MDMRRRVMALQQSLETASCTDDNTYEDEILSGSRCEGFRFASSDLDWMLIYKGIRVIFSLPTEGQHYEKGHYSRQSVIQQNLVLHYCNS